MIKKASLFLLSLLALGSVRAHAVAAPFLGDASKNAGNGAYYDSPIQSSTTGKAQMGIAGNFVFYASSTSKTIEGVIGSTNTDLGVIKSTDVTVRRALVVLGTATISQLNLPGGIDVAGRLAELSQSTQDIVMTVSTNGIAGIASAVASLAITTPAFASSINSLNSATSTIKGRLDNLDVATRTLTLTASNTNFIDTSGSTQTKTGGLTVVGYVTALKFIGDGSSLTGLSGALGSSLNFNGVSVSTIQPGGLNKFTVVSGTGIITADTSTIVNYINSTGTALSNAIGAFNTSTAALTAAINSTGAALTTGLNNVATSTAAQLSLLQATAALDTTKFNNVATATSTLTTAINSTGAALTTGLANVVTATGTLTTAINSTAAALTTALSNILISTRNLQLLPLNTNFFQLTGTQTISGLNTYTSSVIFSSGIQITVGGITFSNGSFLSSATFSGSGNVNTGSTNAWTGGQTFSDNMVTVATSVFITNGQLIMLSTTAASSLVIRKANSSQNFFVLESSQPGASQGMALATSSNVFTRIYFNGSRAAGAGWVIEQPVGTERIIISSGNGYVGIGGIAAPLYQLHVQGGGYVSSSVTVGNLYALGASGIGTAAPAAFLHVQNSAGSSGIQEIISTGTTKLWEVTTSSITAGQPVYLPSASVTTTLIAGGFQGDCSSCTRLNTANILPGALGSSVRSSSQTAQTLETYALKSSNKDAAGLLPQSNGDGTVAWVTPGVNNNLIVTTLTVTSSATLRDNVGNGLVTTKDVRSTNWTSPTTGYFLVGSTTPGNPNFTYVRPDCDQNGNCDQPFNFQGQVTISTNLVMGSGQAIKFADGSQFTTALGAVSGGFVVNGSSSATTNFVQIGTNTNVNSVLTIQSTPGVNVAELRTYVSTSTTMPPEFVSWKWIQGSTITQTNSTGTVLSLPMSTATVMLVNAKVTGYRINGPSGSDGDTAAYELRQAFNRIGTATPIPLGSLASDVFESSAMWNASFSTTATGVNVNVLHGTGTMTAKWSATVGYQILSTGTVAVAAGGGGGGGGGGSLAIDTVTFATTNSNAGLTYSHFVSNSAVNPCILVYTGIRRNTGQTVTGVTYAGVNVPLLLAGDGDRSEPDAWLLMNPALGSNNVVVTASDVNPQLTATSISFNNCTGVGNVTSNQDDTTAATSLSTTSVTTSAQIVTEVSLNDGPNLITPDGGQTVQTNFIGSNYAIETSLKTGGASTTTMGASWTPGARAKIIVVPVK